MATTQVAAQPHTHDLKISVRRLDGADTLDLPLPETATLLEVLQQGAAGLGLQLLPTSAEPLDRLRNLGTHDAVGTAISNLQEELGDFVHEPHTTRNFAIELVLAFRVNARWTVAPSASLTPRQILDLDGIKLDPVEYTLYLPGSTEPLSLDTPITVTRGFVLEAQRDGKYGGMA